jgi:hypothetical protein
MIEREKCEIKLAALNNLKNEEAKYAGYSWKKKYRMHLLENALERIDQHEICANVNQRIR